MGMWKFVENLERFRRILKGLEEWKRLGSINYTRTMHHTTTTTPYSHHATQLPHHATTTRPPHNHHTTTTQPPHSHHTTTTQPPHNHHTTTTHPTHSVKCEKDHVKCEFEQKCVPKDRLCDSKMDCLKGTDEKNCSGE